MTKHFWVALVLAAGFSTTAAAFEPVVAFRVDSRAPTREVTGEITAIDRTNFILTLDNGRFYQAFPSMIAVVEVGSVVTLKHLQDTDLTIVEMHDATPR